MCRTVIARAFAAAALAAGLAGTPSDVPVEVAGTRQAAFQLAATVQTARALPGPTADDQLARVVRLHGPTDLYTARQRHRARYLELVQPRDTVPAIGRGREPGYPGPPAQIRTCALTHTAPTLGG